MANPEHVKKFLEGAAVWNAWRAAKPNLQPDLSDSDFESFGPEPYDVSNLRHFEGYDLSGCNLNRISARNCMFTRCRFAGSDMPFSDLCYSTMQNCDLSEVGMAVTKIGSAAFYHCSFEGADLSYCSAEETEFEGCILNGAKLMHVSLVKTKFAGTQLHRVCVYGASVWDVDLSDAEQSDIFIREDGVGISVPTIELAQFVALILDNRKVRDFIDTMTSKMVLILGRFTPERKDVLDRLKSALSRRGYLPVIFDFDEPDTRDVRETVKTLASLSRFVVADLSEPRSVPLELEAIVPQFPSLPIQPIIVASERPFSMFASLARYRNVMPLVVYDHDVDHSALATLISQCEDQFDRQALD